MQGMKVVFQVGLALLRFCHDDLVSFLLFSDYYDLIVELNLLQAGREQQVKLPFERLIHALRNFPEDATNPDTLLPLALSFKVKIKIHVHFLINI